MGVGGCSDKFQSSSAPSDADEEGCGEGRQMPRPSSVVTAPRHRHSTPLRARGGGTKLSLSLNRSQSLLAVLRFCRWRSGLITVKLMCCSIPPECIRQMKFFGRVDLVLYEFIFHPPLVSRTGMSTFIMSSDLKFKTEA